MSAVPIPNPKHIDDQILLKGDVPSPANPPNGCFFHPRCKYAIDLCSYEEPGLFPDNNGRLVRCWMYDSEKSTNYFVDKDYASGNNLVRGVVDLMDVNRVKEKRNGHHGTNDKDVLITSQLRTALIFNKKIKSANYSIDTYKKKIYIYGIAESKEEQSLVIEEAKQILDVEDVISSILLVEDLRIQKN